jgi:hypothetical protein
MDEIRRRIVLKQQRIQLLQEEIRELRKQLPAEEEGEKD